MDNLVSRIKAELERVSWTSSGAHIKTGDVRKIASQAFRSLGDRSKDHVFSLCEELLEQRSWPMKVIAFDFAYRVRRQYNQADFAVFQRWLEEYVRGWGDCDDFCTHAFGELICQYPELSRKTLLWTERREFWLRRAAAVVLIPSIRRDKYMETDPLQVADLLMQDEHDLVRQGYGWMLKELSAKEPDLVFTYLRKHRAVMPRVAFRCALEKLGEERRRILMQ
ncbi:MAG: DNA alkylation repair protein [Limnochordia bacterium]|jgi:3-methyladenine DNA glycosylase AlkD